MPTRQEVYAAINTERAYQDRRWPRRPGVNTLSIGDFVLLMDEYVARARAEWTTEKAPEMKTVDIVRKIAGIAVACMEQYGAPVRTE